MKLQDLLPHNGLLNHWSLDYGRETEVLTASEDWQDWIAEVDDRADFFQDLEKGPIVEFLVSKRIQEYYFDIVEQYALCL